MTAPTILFLTTDLQDLDILTREAAHDGALTFAACPSPALVLDQLEREACLGLLIDSTLPAAARRETIERVRTTHPGLPIIALTAPGDGEVALEAGATAFVTKRGPFASRVVALMTACLEAGTVGASVVESSSHLLSFGLTPAQVMALDRAGRSTYAATVATDGLRLLDGTLVDAAAFDGALVSEAGLEQATDVLVDVRSHAPHLNLVGVATGDNGAFALATERLGGVPLTVTADNLPAAIDQLVPLLQARRSAVDELLVARTNELRVRAVVECAPSSILLLDADGTCLAMNWAGLSVLGYDDAAAVVGHDFGTRVAPEDTETFAHLLASVAGGARHEVTVSCLDAAGATIRLRILGVPLARETAGAFSVLCTIATSSNPDQQSTSVALPVDDAVAELARLAEAVEVTARERDHYAERVIELEREHAALPDQGLIDADAAAAHAAAAVETASLALRVEHEAALASLHADLVAARQSAEASEATVARLTDQVSANSALTQRCELVETWLHEAEARCDDLQRQLNARPAEAVVDTAAVERLESELATLRAAEAIEREAAEAARAEAVDSLTQLEAMSLALEEERVLAVHLREASARAAALEQELSSRLEDREALAAELNALRSEHEALRSHVAALEVELADASQALGSERRRLSDQQPHVEHLEAKVATLTAALADADAARHGHDALSESLAELAASRDRLQGALEAASRVEAELREELAAARVAMTAELEARERALEATLNRAARERDELVDRLSEGTTLRESLAEETAVLRAHLAEARESEDSLRSARDEQAAALGHARRELDALAHQHQIALADAAATRARLQAADEELRVNAAAYDAARSALARERDERAAADASIGALGRDLTAVHSELAAIRSELASVEAERDRVTVAHARAAEELAALVDSLSQTRDESAALADARAQAAESLTATQGELSRVTSECDAGRVRIAVLEGQLAEALDHASEFEQAQRALQARLDEEMALRSRLKEQLTHVHNQSETTSELATRVADLEQQLAGSLAQAQAAAADLEQARGECDRLASEHGRLTSARDSLTSEVSCLASEHDRLKSERDRIAGERDRLAGEREQGAAELERLAADRDALAAERGRLRAECDRLTRAERTAHSEAAARAEDLQRLRGELEAAVAARTQAAARLESVHDEVASLRASLAAEQRARRRDAAEQAEARTYHSTAQRLQSELDRALAELAEQQRQLEEYRALHLSLESGLRSAEATLDQLADTQRRERSRSDARRKELERARVALRDRERDLQRVKELALSAKDTLERERVTARSEAAARRSAEQAADLRARDLERELDRLQANVDVLEARVRDRDAHWTQFWNEAPVGLATTTAEGRVLACNPILAEWLDADGDRGHGILPAVSMDAGATTTREIVLNGRDGGARYVLEHSTCRREQQQVLVERTLIDVSRAHALASELREAKRFESVGRLTVRMIDDLCGVVDRLDVYARQGGRRTTTAGRDTLGDLSEATSRALDLVRQLQQHAKRQLRNDPEFEAEPVLHALLPVLKRMTGDDIDWRIEEVGDATLAADRYAFEHLLTTLAVSVREALPEGGVAILNLSATGARPGGSGDGGVLELTVRGYGLLEAPDEAIRAAAQRCGGTLTVHPSDHAFRWQVSFGDVTASLDTRPRSRRAS